MFYDEKLYASIAQIEKQYEQLQAKLTQPDLDYKQIIAINKLLKDHQPVVDKFQTYKKIIAACEEANTIINQESNAELIALANLELNENKPVIASLETTLKKLLLPKDADDEKNVVVEMRPAAGGDEAAIFVADVFTLYKKWADVWNWKLKVLEAQPATHGYSFIAFLVQGEQVYAKMKYESGVHRVQRVPLTEAKGRVHTSTITVAVLPEAEEVEVAINPADLRIDTYRASGAGGQHVNRTESAVRITHLPTNIVVACQEGKSQIENRETAMKILRAKIYEAKQAEAQQTIANMRRSQVGRGERAEKIRTYNYPQNRITDHRVNLTLNKLDVIMVSGDLSEIVNALISADEASKMAKFTL